MDTCVSVFLGVPLVGFVVLDTHALEAIAVCRCLSAWG